MKARFDGWHSDTSRIDADQLRLRTYDAHGDYFQFFSVIIPGPHFRTIIHQPGSFTFNQFKRAVLALTLREIRRVVDGNEVPLANRTTAFEVFPDLEEAGRQARHATDEPLVNGEPFDVP